uniref:Uncharacterized protein n=1 Tax=Manihot esculenta TaxID=3983 RepID=A0A2C9VXN0_MANES
MDSIFFMLKWWPGGRYEGRSKPQMLWREVVSKDLLALFLVECGINVWLTSTS